MRLIVATLLLLCLTSGISGKPISKRHVRRDWLVLPDTIAFYLYESVNKVSPSTGKALKDIFEMPQVQKVRGYLIWETSKLSVQAENLYNTIVTLWQKDENPADGN